MRITAEPIKPAPPGHEDLHVFIPVNGDMNSEKLCAAASLSEMIAAPGQFPIYSKAGVVPGDASIAIRGVVIRTFILDDHIVRQRRKAVQESFRNPELRAVLRTQLDRDMLTIRWEKSLRPRIDGDIDDCSLGTPHELTLWMRRRLEMQGRARCQPGRTTIGCLERTQCPAPTASSNTL